MRSIGQIHRISVSFCKLRGILPSDKDLDRQEGRKAGRKAGIGNLFFSHRLGQAGTQARRHAETQARRHTGTQLRHTGMPGSDGAS